MNIVRKCYNWVLSWSDSKWGGTALFLFAFAEATFFPIPPDVLLLALCLGTTRKSFKYALICLAGTLLGAVSGYLIGYFLWQNAAGQHTALAMLFYNHVFSLEAFDKVRMMFEQYDFWIIFTAGFTPIPYKIFTIAAGVFKIDFGMFMIASLVSRGARFFLVAWLIWKFGPPIKGFIDKYFNLLAIAFTILLIGSFVLVKYLV